MNLLHSRIFDSFVAHPLDHAPGVAEAEFEVDPEAAIRRVWYSMSGDGPGRTDASIMAPGAEFLDATVEPESLPE